jgi:hypothetical protein
LFIGFVTHQARQGLHLRTCRDRETRLPREYGIGQDKRHALRNCVRQRISG